MAKPTKLELTWIGKENQPRLEPRILIEDPAKSHHAPFRVGDKDNPSVQSIVLTGADEGQLQVVAEVVEVLGGP